MSTQTSRIEILKSELKVLKEQQQQEKIASKTANKWIKWNRLASNPEVNRAFVWSHNRILCAWFLDQKWYEYDGTWMLKNDHEIPEVTHWMGTDWMSSKVWPLHGPGIANCIRYYWRCFTQGASDMAVRNMPKRWGRNAQLDKKIVYYRNEKTGEIRMGLPENFPASKGFQKVVCGSAREAEAWSDRLRQYNLSKERMKDEERAQIEGEQAREIRGRIHHLMANSRSKYGKVFMERALERMDKAESRRKMVREEYLHLEGHEHGH